MQYGDDIIHLSLRGHSMFPEKEAPGTGHNGVPDGYRRNAEPLKINGGRQRRRHLNRAGVYYGGRR